MASKLVGENGFVIGVDMTDEQLAVARRHVDSMREKFGYNHPNVDFRKGFIEDLKAMDVKENIAVIQAFCPAGTRNIFPVSRRSLSCSPTHFFCISFKTQPAAVWFQYHSANSRLLGARAPGRELAASK